jgi:hypothetical protein
VKNNKKEIYYGSFLTLGLLLLFQFLPISNVVASEPKENALTFLTNVANIDLSRYNSTLVSDQVAYNTAYGGHEIRYNLKNDNNTLDTTFMFKDDKLVWCTIYVLSGEPIFAKKATDDLYLQANELLEQYQSYTGSSKYQAMQDTLKLIDYTKDSTVVLGDTKLTTYSDGLAKGFTWTTIYNGVEVLTLQIEFYNGYLETFNDQGALFTIGSSIQNIDQQKAISIALDQAKNFSWTIGSDPATAVEVSSFTVNDEDIQATLSMQVREDSTLYPMWRVELPINEIHVGDQVISDMASSVVVGIWADTGAINYCHEISYGGTIPTDSQSDNSAGWLYLTLMAGAVVAATLIVVTSVVLKKRTK